jgi:hypothetical protein
VADQSEQKSAVVVELVAVELVGVESVVVESAPLLVVDLWVSVYRAFSPLLGCSSTTL